MEQQIRGWRIAAERTQKRRGSRDVPIAPSAKMMGGMALMGCRALSRMAVRAKDRSRARVPAAPSVDTTDVQRMVRGLGVVAAGMAAARLVAARPRPGRTMTTKDRAPKNRWIMVTINCAPQRLASRADLPEPITRLGDAVDIKICPAPGDRGTELGARLRDLPRTRIAGMVARRPEENPRRMVEQALREAKAMIEAGEALRPDWPPTAVPAPVGKLLEFAGRRGGRQ
jgi:hypothetical protein